MHHKYPRSDKSGQQQAKNISQAHTGFSHERAIDERYCTLLDSCVLWSFLTFNRSDAISQLILATAVIPFVEPV